MLSTCAFQPVLCLISLVGAFLYGICARGLRAVCTSIVHLLPFVAIVSLLNPFFTAQGSTELFTLVGRPIYTESLMYGVCMGMLLAAMVLWCENAAAVMTGEDALMLAGPVAPTLALMLSMIMRLIPLYIRRGRLIGSVEAACTAVRPLDGGNAARRTSKASLAGSARRFSVLVGWSLENSLQTADSMAARGWRASSRRTPYRRIAFCRADGMLIACIVALTVGSVIALASSSAAFSFYPVLSAFDPGASAWVYGALLAVPLLMEAREALRWMR